MTDNQMTLLRMSNLIEELGAAQIVAARIIRQGIGGVDPVSGKTNRQHLMDALADVQAQIGCTVLAFVLDQHCMGVRTAEKMRQTNVELSGAEPQVKRPTRTQG
jgi:hypothetical protein